MLTYIEADLFTSRAQVLVNTVNTVGVMGKGIAKQFRERYPAMFADYKQRCDFGELHPGTLLLYRASEPWILNFPTKRHWKAASRVDDIERGLVKFVATYAAHGIGSVAFPQLGCGNGQLDWETDIRLLMERYLAPLPIPVAVHLYSAANGAGSALDPAAVAPDSPLWPRLLAMVRGGTLPGWSLSGGDVIASPRLRFVDWEWTEQDLRDLWRRLATVGYLAESDIAASEPRARRQLLNLLTQLAPARQVRAIVVQGQEQHLERRTTDALLAESRGALLPRGTIDPAWGPSDVEVNTGVQGWRASQMPMPSLAMSTS